ncbi:MAG: hypothetical protein K2X82_21925, partial [Gemmataceae bacterium]|nr:hypothetical protein [Gemmataceae bacterium]
RARALAERGEVAAARAALEAAADRYPDSVGVRAALCQVLIRAGAGPAEVEAAARAVLAVDPGNAQARHNLEVALRRADRWLEGVSDAVPPG